MNRFVFFLIAFGVVFSSQAQSAGSSCGRAIQVSGNQINNTEANISATWYKYRASGNRRVEITSLGHGLPIDTRVSVYDECGGIMLRSNDNAFPGTFLSSVSLPMYGGQTVYIEWEGTPSRFTWSVFVSAAQQGDLCEAPNQAVTGTNKVTNFVGGVEREEWFEYTPSQSGLMTVSNCNLTDVATDLSIYESCRELLIDGNDCLASQSSVTVPVKGGENYYILWENEPGESGFNWKIDIDAFSQGENCIEPFTSGVGTNTADHTVFSTLYYEFVSTSDAVLTIDNCNLTSVDTKVSLYEECGTTAIAQNDDFCATQSSLVYLVKRGQPYTIAWESKETGVTYDWNLTLSDIMIGDICSQPKTASVGTNQSDHSDRLSDWFSFTPTANGNLTLSNCEIKTGDVEVSIYTECSGSALASGSTICEDGETISLSVEKSQTYLIQWDAKANVADYNWQLDFEDISGGNNCEEAVNAKPGSNYADNVTGSEWYQISFPENTIVTLKAPANEQTMVYIYESCTSDTLYASHQLGADLRFGIPANTTYLIEWSGDFTQEDYFWELSADTTTNIKGWICSEAIEFSTLDINTPVNGHTWLKYTGQYDGNLLLRACENNLDTRIRQYDSCGGQELAADDDGVCEDDFLLNLTTEKDSVYYFLVESHTTGNFTGDEFEIRVDITWLGTRCEFPLTAQEGINEAEADLFNNWFTYTPERTGQLKISSCDLTDEDTEVNLYSECTSITSPNRIAYNVNGCGEQSSLAYGVEAGVTYYIRWRNRDVNGPYSWQLTLEDWQEGQVCEFPLQAKEGVNQADHSDGTSQWYTYDVPENGRIKITFCEFLSNSGLLLMYDECGGSYRSKGFNCNSTFIDNNYSFEVSGGETLLLSWFNNNVFEQYDWGMEFISAESNILDVSVDSQVGDARINQTDHEVVVDVLYGTSLIAIAPTFTLSSGATISPDAGTTRNFTGFQTYTVTSADGNSSTDWKVFINRLPNSAADIIDIAFAGKYGASVIDNESHTLYAEISDKEDISTIEPTFTLSPGATVSPTGPQSFEEDVVFTVTAEDGLTTTDWTVNVQPVFVTDIAETKDFRVFPNPATSFITVNSGQNIQSVRLFSLSGKMLRSQEMSENTQSLSLS
ncbi:MAG: hypothetical protein WBA74_17850, partial [Cyclobacteriaceae bacterium]